jgi:hypothetical protein
MDEDTDTESTVLQDALDVVHDIYEGTRVKPVKIGYHIITERNDIREERVIVEYY